MGTERAVLDSECFVEQETLGKSARSGHHGPDATDDRPGLFPFPLKLAADVLSTFPDEAHQAVHVALLSFLKRFIVPQNKDSTPKPSVRGDLAGPRE